MDDDRKDPLVRRGSLLLSALMLTPDKALDTYRKRRCGDATVELHDLKTARELLDAVAYAIAGNDPDNFRRIHDAWQIVRRIPRPASEETTQEPAANAAESRGDKPVAARAPSGAANGPDPSPDQASPKPAPTPPKQAAASTEIAPPSPKPIFFPGSGRFGDPERRSRASEQPLLGG